MDVLNRLQDVFRDIFDDDTIVLTRETTAADIEEWDSLAQINIIVACEGEFEVRYDLKEVNALSNVGGMVDLTERKLSDKAE